MNNNITKQVRTIYLEDPLHKHMAVITKIGADEINKKNYKWIQLDETIFHPKGGGQPSDTGMIGGVNVAYIHKEFFDKSHLERFEIYHCFEADQPFNFKVGDEVELSVDAPTRLLHSRLHTAGHVLSEAVNKCFPELEAYQGNHYPNNSYVKFKIRVAMPIESKDVVKQKVEAEFNCWLDQNLTVSGLLEPSGIRRIRIFENWVPCGGTHVKSLKEIGQMQISDLSINKKDGTVTIKYCL